MGLFNTIFGVASEVNANEIKEKYPELLLEEETVEFACKIIRDRWIFTDRRLVMIDVQGVTGSKKSFHSVPYRSITHFDVESAGTFDMDSEVKIWISSTDEPIVKELKRGFDVFALQRILTYFTCR